MSFFKKLFRKKYPKNKIDTENDPIDVYAGPEPDEPCEPVKCDGEVTKEVYAGPVKFAKKPGPLFARVYAGPSKPVKKGKPPIEAVYAGPDLPASRTDQPIALVYAGPKKIDPPDDIKLLVICDKCGEENDADSEVCKKCGAKL